MIQAVIALAALGAGVGMSIYGSSKEEEAAKKQAAQAKKASKEAKKAAKQEKKIINKTIIPLMEAQMDAQEAASKASQEAEKLRAKQMELDASRTKREIIRNAAIARANSLSAAANQGALGSSGFFGSLNQITSDQNRQLGGLFQNLTIGRGIFEFNRQASEYITEANRLGTQENIERTKLGNLATRANATQQAYSAKAQAAGINDGAMYSNIGSSLMGSATTISQLGTTALFGKQQ
jgi:hypothetical protein